MSDRLKITRGRGSEETLGEALVMPNQRTIDEATFEHMWEQKRGWYTQELRRLAVKKMREAHSPPPLQTPEEREEMIRSTRGD